MPLDFEQLVGTLNFSETQENEIFHNAVYKQHIFLT